MKTPAILFLMGVIGFGVLVACTPSPNPTAADVEALNKLQNEYLETYQFEFIYDVYVKAKSKNLDQIEKREAVQIFQAFRLDSHGKPKTDSNIAYFNFYNKDDVFLFQIYWDLQKSEFGFSEQAFY